MENNALQHSFIYYYLLYIHAQTLFLLLFSFRVLEVA